MHQGDVEQDREEGKKSPKLSDFTEEVMPSLSPPAKKLIND